jgi:hypothetical protein
MAEPALGAVARRLVGAVLSAAISLGVLGTVAESFWSRGMPFERLVALERACAGHLYASDRDACVRAALAACTALRRDLTSRQC